MGGDKKVAVTSGIDVDRVCGLSKLCCGAGGLVLVGRTDSAHALMAEGIEFQTIATVVTGSSVFGTLIGAILIGVLNNGLHVLNVRPFWQGVVNGLLIIVVVVFDQWRRRLGE